MTDSTTSATGLPPVVRARLDEPSPAPRDWLRTVAPAYLGVVTWFPLLDALGGINPEASVLHRWLSCLLALGACYLLVYLPLAGLGLRTRQRLPVVAAEALGARGSEWIAGVLHGLFAAIWGSAAIWYSVRMTLDGLTAWGLLDPSDAPNAPAGIGLEGPLVLAALAWWGIIILAANGLNLMGVIAALMRVYSPFAGVLIVAAALWAWWRGGVGDVGGTLRPVASPVFAPDVIQYVFGAFAFAGLMAVEWGAAIRDRRDARLGGWTAILAAGAVTTLAALAMGSWNPTGTARGTLDAWPDHRIGGALLLLLGLASLAPACYASSLFESRFRAHWPGMGKWKGAGLSYLLLVVPGAVGIASDVSLIASVSGALFAPLAGVLAVSALRRDPGGAIRAGWRVAGLAAWGAGVAVALAPVVAPDPRWARPAALAGWVVAAVAHAALPRPRAERSA